MCANASNRKRAHDAGIEKILGDMLVNYVIFEGDEQLLLQVILCIRNASGFSLSRRRFLDELNALYGLANVIQRRNKKLHSDNEKDDLSWQAASAMVVVYREKETKEGLNKAVNQIMKRGYGEICAFLIKVRERENRGI